MGLGRLQGLNANKQNMAAATAQAQLIRQRHALHGQPTASGVLNIADEYMLLAWQGSDACT
jgi:hypothetical protein